MKNSGHSSVIEMIPSREELLEIFGAWGPHHPLHTHPYLDELFDERTDDIGRVKRFVEVLYVFCETFHDCLLAIALNAKDEAIRRAIVGNLYEEFGAGKTDRAHLGLMRKLLYSLGYTDDSINSIRINPGAERFVSTILSLCRDEHYMKAIGCVCIGAECNGSIYFRKIYHALARKSCTSSADLYVLEIHAEDDVEHRESMLRLIDPHLDSPESRRLLHEGFLMSVHLFQELWTSMSYYEMKVA